MASPPPDTGRGRSRSPRNSRRSSYDRGSSNALNRLEPMESYKAFMMHQDESTAPEVYLTRYDEYKKRYQQRLKQAFFDDFKKQEWLQKRYSPAIRHRAMVELHRQMETLCSEFIAGVEANSLQFCYDEESMDNSENVLNNLKGRMLYIRRVPCSCPESALQEVIATGGEYKSIHLSDPAKRLDCDFDRSAWVLYESEEDANAAMGKIHNAFLHDADMPTPVRLQVSMYRQRAPLKTPSSASLPDRISFDAEQAYNLSKALDKSTFGKEKEQELYGVEKLLSAKSFPTDKEKLDTLIGYLRHVHSYIYYAGKKCLDYGDVLHTHPAEFCRSAATDRDLEDDAARKENPAEGRWSSWASKLDDSVQVLLEELDSSQHSTEMIAEEKEIAKVELLEEQALLHVYDTYATEVDDTGKQRCDLCKKLFKAASFARKHIKNKHPELVLDKTAEAAEDFMWQHYNDDPNAPVPLIQASSKVTLGSNNRQRGGHSFSRSHGSRGSYEGSYGRGGRDSSGGGRDYPPHRGGPRYDRGPRDGGHRFDGRGRNNFRRDSRDGSNHQQRRPEPMNSDTRQVHSYQDMDNIQGATVELDFNVLGSLPPPKKKKKTE